jgi:hypothetical protein
MNVSSTGQIVMFDAVTLSPRGFDQGYHFAAFLKPIEIIRPRLHHLHSLGPKFRAVRISSAHRIGLLVRELTLYGIWIPSPISFSLEDAMLRNP